MTCDSCTTCEAWRTLSVFTYRKLRSLDSCKLAWFWCRDFRLQQEIYVLSYSESVHCNFFILDNVTFIQFKICCCVQNFIVIGWFFAEIWRYIDFQNGGRPPSWNCLTTLRDYPRSLCCWPLLPVKFNVNLIHRSEYIAIWIFRIFGLKCLFRPPKSKFWGTWTHKCDCSSSRPPKTHPCINLRRFSYQLSKSV